MDKATVEALCTLISAIVAAVGSIAASLIAVYNAKRISAKVDEHEAASNVRAEEIVAATTAAAAPAARTEP